MEKKIKPPYVACRGRVFCLEPESKNEELNMVLVISNELHNQFANHLIVALVTDKNVEQVRPSLEIACHLESKKMKVLVSHLHTINKENFYRLGHYIGKLDEKTMKKINEHIKSVLDLDN